MEEEIDINAISQSQDILFAPGDPSMLFFVTSARTSLDNERGNEIKFQCKLCGKTFIQARYLKFHERKHETTRNFECSICLKAFKQKANLSSHMTTHLDHNDNKCNECSKQFKNRVCLLKHIRFIHKNRRKFICDICNIVKYSRATIIAHLNLHAGVKPFKCPLCPKAFLYKHALKNHKAKHSTKPVVKTLSCELCGKRYSYRCQLNEHILSHSSNWLCSLCGKNFTHESALKTHYKLHEDSRPWMCNICNVSFGKRSTLDVHVLKEHEKQGPSFMCEKCPKMFFTNSSLKQHRARHKEN